MMKSDLRYLVDVGVGRNVEEFLIKQVYDSKTIRSIDPRLSDKDILNIAARGTFFPKTSHQYTMIE